MNEMLNWYEMNLPPRERKRRGHFSTPPQLVEQILDACGYTAEHDLTTLRVLDPACGSGNFLAGAARRLVASCQRRGREKQELSTIVQRNLWGFDPDPVSCVLAEMQLRAVLNEAVPASDESSCSQTLPSLHIHQADGLALAWEQGECADLFLANPPYLAAKNNDLSVYRSARQRGQADSYLLFLELALYAVKPGGWLGLVLPDALLARANAARERHRLLRQTTVHRLWHLANVFSAYVGAVVIIAQKLPPARMHHIQWTRATWTRKGPASSASSGAIAQDLLLRQPGAEMRYLLSVVENPLVARLHAHLCEFANTKRASQPTSLVPLAQLVSIHRGEELGKAAAQLAVHPPADGQIWYPVLRGGVDIRPYAIPHGRCWIARTAVDKPLERYLAPRLLVVKSAGQLQAALDLEGHIVLQTLYLLAPRQKGEQQRILDEFYFLLALLNSRLMREYVRVLYTAYKWVQPQIEQHVLARLPIPTLETAEKASIIERARLLVQACSHLTSIVELKESRQIYEEQEHAISALYAAALQPKAEVQGRQPPGGARGVLAPHSHSLFENEEWRKLKSSVESIRQVDKGVKGVYLDG